MKTAKRLASILLTLCMLIGLPVAVQAVGTNVSAYPDTLELLNVFELPDDMVIRATDKGKYAILQFNTQLGTADRNTAPTTTDLNVKIEVRKEGVILDDGTCSGTLEGCYFTGSSTQNFYKLRFTSGALSFDSWRAQGADQFNILIWEMSTAASPQNGYIDSWTRRTNADIALTATTQITDGGIRCDAVKIVMVQKNDLLRYEQAVQLSDTMLMAKFSEAVDVSRYKTAQGFDFALCVVGDDNTVLSSVDTQGSGSLEKVGDLGWVKVPVDAAVMAAAKETLEANPGSVLKLKVYEKGSSAYAGEHNENYMIDSIFSATNKALCVSSSGGSGNTMAMVALTDWTTKQALVDGQNGMVAYDSVADAVSAANAGETVTMLNDAVNADPIFVLNAGVNLDLNGYMLTVNNYFAAFGNIVDSSDGEGKLVVSKDNCLRLLANNEAMPLYDEDGYRFFTYEFRFKKDDSVTDSDQVKYKFGLGFDNAYAYTLFTDADNADMHFGVRMSVTKDGREYGFYWEVPDAYMTQKQTIILTISGMNSLADASYTAQAYLEGNYMNLTGALDSK